MNVLDGWRRRPAAPAAHSQVRVAFDVIFGIVLPLGFFLPFVASSLDRWRPGIGAFGGLGILSMTLWTFLRSRLGASAAYLAGPLLAVLTADAILLFLLVLSFLVPFAACFAAIFVLCGVPVLLAYGRAFLESYARARQHRSAAFVHLVIFTGFTLSLAAPFLLTGPR